MKCMKILMAAGAAAALVTFFGTGIASADVVTSPAGTAYTGTVDWSLESGTSTKIVDTAGKELDTCTQLTDKGTITNHGAGKPVSGSIETLEWGSCTFVTKTLKTNGFEVKGGVVKATGEFHVTINTVFFGSCIYGVTSGTALGTLSASGTFTANAVTEKFSGSGFVCPETSKWTGSTVATQPVPFTYALS
jgi:hypothetical protein